MAISPGPYLKAIVAGTLAGLGKLYLALGDNTVTAQEGVEIAIYAITAAAAIYGVPNTPAAKQAPPQPQQYTGPAPYLPPAPATRWPAAAVNSAALDATTAADAAALAAAAAARNPGAGA